jgi:Flp pilus assembly protein CpaB
MSEPDSSPTSRLTPRRDAGSTQAIPGSPGSSADPRPAAIAPAGGARLVLVAAALAIVAVVLLNLYIVAVKRQNQSKMLTRYELLATLRPGEKLQAKDLKPVKVPEQFEQAFSRFISDADIALKFGQTVRRPAYSGELLAYDVFKEAQGADLDQEITPGFRLYALPVNSRGIIGGLRPGMFVDIEAPFHAAGGGGEGTPIVLPIMERVKLKTVGGRSIADEAAGEAARRAGSFQTVGIEVTPQATDKLSMIQKMAVGEFELILRNPADDRLIKIPNPDPDTFINPAVLKLLPTTAR